MMWLDFTAAVFAFVAAVFWFASAYGKLPPKIDYWDETPPTDPFYMAIKFSARMNRFAAGFSCLSALAMGLSLLFSKSAAG